MGNDDLALPLRREAFEVSRGLSPCASQPASQTQESAGDLGQLLVEMGDEAAGAPLLWEAVQGLTAVYGAVHHLISCSTSGRPRRSDRPV